MTANKVLTPLALAGVLLISGCAMSRGDGMRAEQGDRHMDMSRMCEMHRQMTAGKSSAEQRAAVESHIKSMHGSVSPDMVDHHMKMMAMHCGDAASAPRKANRALGS